MQDERWVTEWQLLQAQADGYEKHGLLIKLVAVALATVVLLAGHAGPAGIAIIALLWLQDAIWKTFQGRLEQRLLVVEARLAGQGYDDEQPFQLNTVFLEQRRGTVGLVGEYLAQALRPTVAYPYVAVVALLAAVWLLAG